jgi:hypothetical protein
MATWDDKDRGVVTSLSLSSHFLLGRCAIGRFEWEDVQRVLRERLVRDEFTGDLIALSPGKFDDLCRRCYPLLPRSKRILEHFKLPPGRWGWEILMDVVFGAYLTQPENVSAPGEKAEWERCFGVWLKNRFGLNEWSDDYTENPIDRVLSDWF